ncbi:UDP-N-acetylmuramoyl-L-alanyl-D-glutamate--2,6-diaminopimelate ligase [Candidatus Parcubacteria bacterium]|nr:UDP-N-acetylmuramoyl-L-alanyl-D-glutamate--2,6-diaminopimelate ligase [Patescibacteria group bacterium]MCG2694277.1 UDP-N-acetylmuramoyl-L-alanyl-D-glutamate--2,6-diaminopimelate ligase [Candidatus Parcubacteria bacterium]
MKRLLKKIVPKWAIRFYHWLLANLGALVYRYPSRKIIVIGVTGTKGKSTTSYLIAKLLEEFGNKVGLTSTIIFKIGKKEWLNDKKMTMLGRFHLQKLLRQMVNEGCKYVIIETSSEGIAQYRHSGIDYDIAVFTNLSPEHIESHGSYSKYKKAKSKLFSSLERGREKGVPKTAIINLDDKEADYFLGFNNNNVGYTLKNSYKKQAKKIISAKNLSVSESGIKFFISDIELRSKLLGEFNAYNILAAIACCDALGKSLPELPEKVEKIESVPGRMEFINEGQNFQVIVDYAHEPVSMRALYGIVREIPHKRVIHIFGATGGGRDKSRRPILGEIADQNASIIVLTNDDPYEENQEKIVSDIKKGIKKKKEGESFFVVMDRKKAIEDAVMQAEEGDILLITGKGSEQKIAIDGKMLPWDDRDIARQAIKLKLKK